MTRPRDIADSINRINSSAADATAVTIDSSEQVGIGTATPNSYYSKELVVAHGTEGGITLVGAAGTATGYLMFADGTTGNEAYRGYVGYSHSTPDVMVFGTSGAERMRIDGSGNVGIGTSPSVKLDIDNGSLKVNRGNSSGDIAVFRGLNAEKVKIDTDGIKFNGDTAAANALDDYEEGTWTATTNQGSVTTNGGTYTKIGNQVTIRGNLSDFTDTSNGSAVQITGLPFTSASNSYGVGACMIRFVNTGGREYVQAYLGANSGTMFLYALDTSSNDNWTPVTYSNANQAWDIIFTMSYIVQ